MTSRSRRGLLVVLALAAAALAVASFAGYQVWNRHQMLKTTLAWARLAPLPASARGCAITTSGSMFTRSFQAAFTAPLSDVERWLDESPGTRGVTPERPDSTTRYFLIVPGGGAQRAELMVDDRAGRVSIRVSWS